VSFVFSLRALLRVREIREETELRKLQALLSRISAARAEISALEEALETDRRNVRTAALGGLSAAEWHFHNVHDLLQRDRRNALLAKLRELESAVRAQQERYRLARQQREILSNLRERQLAAYNLEESRRAQRQMDELFLLRMSSRRDGLSDSDG
jgi:flagellar export protein FliJ